MSNVVYGEEAVAIWAKERAGWYGLTVNDFSTSFNDGRVVTAIIHSLFPQEFDFKSMTFAKPVCRSFSPTDLWPFSRTDSPQA